jgi:Raf kinase inhibitor-like YbhB/YbcL family protein
VDTGGTAPVGGSGGSGGSPDNLGGAPSTFVVTSPAFETLAGCSVDSPSSCDVFPDENVSYEDNANVSPELEWTGAPAGTQSFAVVLVDVTFGQAHWVLWNIPADATLLAADVPQDTAMPTVPAGSQQANANFATTSEHGYFGPHIPCNVFAFEVYALSVSSFAPANPDSAVLVWAELQNHDGLLGVAKLTGRSGDYGTACP